MTALNQIQNRVLWYLFCLSALLLVLGTLRCLIRTARYGRGRRYTVLAGCNLLLAAGIFLVLMDCVFIPVLAPEDLARVRPFQWRLFSLPWLSFGIPGMLSALLLLWQLLDNARYRRSHLTPGAIQETLDLLPEGLAVSRQDGTVLLTNLKMNELSRALTGAGLTDAERFRICVEEVGKEQNGQYWAALPNGTVWQFEQGSLRTETGEYACLRATDVTERYRIVEDLETKHAHLQDVRQRMQAVSELSGDMFVAQEEANARVALHNQLGQVLLMGRHLIEHPDSTDPRMVWLTTKQMNAFLLGEAKTLGREREDPLQDAIAAANSIGVAVELHGMLPQDEPLRSLLSQAIRECAANAVKHAGGDRLTVSVRKDGQGFSVGSNGCPPRQAIRESGGLLHLRRQTESVGGTMRVEAAPAFSLTIEVS